MGFKMLFLRGDENNMLKLEWNEVGKYNRKIMWNKQNLNLPELNQEVLIFFPYTDANCRKIPFDEHGRVIIGYFYLTEDEEVCITDGVYSFGYIHEGILWADYNRPSQPDRQVKICENFICKNYNMGEESKCNIIPCEKCSDRACANCKMYLAKSPNCKNSKLW